MKVAFLLCRLSSATTIVVAAYAVLGLLMLPSVAAQSSSCEEPLVWTRQPNTFSLSEYSAFRGQCTALCNANGNCCTKDVGICDYAPCTTGCHIAWTTSSVQQCKAECQVANNAGCDVSFAYWDYSQVAEAGLSPSFEYGVDLMTCDSAETCGCPSGQDGDDCSEDACALGCELTNDRSIQDNFFNGPNVAIDPHIGLDLSGLLGALVDIKAHVDGTTTLSDTQLQARSIIFSQNKELLDEDESAIVAAFALIEAYERREGPLFINSKTEGGFLRSGSGDGLTLERVIFEVKQAVLDEVYRTKTTPSERRKGSITENCRDFLTGRTFQTARYFPGWVDPPPNPSVVHNVNIEASKPSFWGMFICFAEDPALKPTGLYLTPGGVSTVTVPPALVNKGYRIRLGAADADHTEKEFHRRLDRISGVYEITKATTYISSPLGGGIYIMVPYEADDGIAVIQISGSVVKAPFFSLTSHKTTTEAEWNGLKNSAAPWADFVTDLFFMQVPSSWIRSFSYSHFLDLMMGRQEVMADVSRLLGVDGNLRNDYFAYIQPDVEIRHGAFGVGYPQINTVVSSGPNGPDPRPDHWLVTDKYIDWNVFWHENGHCTMGWDYYEGETEAIVNLLDAFVGNTLMGLDIDSAFKVSFSDYNGFNPDEAFKHWAVTANFRSGNEMDKSNTESDEMRYQERGYAKYIDIVRLYGWGAYQKFNDLRQSEAINGIFIEDLEGDDYRTLQLSKSLGVDATPLIHFWGIHPDNPERLKAELDANNLGPDEKIKDFLLRYVTIIPADNAAFKKFMYSIYPEIDDAVGAPQPLTQHLRQQTSPLLAPMPPPEEGCGNCDESRGDPGCSSSDCQELVCEGDAFCCDVEWDDLCRDVALEECSCGVESEVSLVCINQAVHDMITHDDIAREFRGHLLSIHDEYTNDLAKGLAEPGSTGVWIGLNDRDEEGEWVWSDTEEPATFLDFWRENRNRGSRDCVHLHPPRFYRWDIRSCSLEMRGLYRLPSGSYCEATGSEDTINFQCVVEGTEAPFSDECLEFR